MASIIQRLLDVLIQFNYDHGTNFCIFGGVVRDAVRAMLTGETFEFSDIDIIDRTELKNAAMLRDEILLAFTDQNIRYRRHRYEWQADHIFIHERITLNEIQVDVIANSTKTLGETTDVDVNALYLEVDLTQGRIVLKSAVADKVPLFITLNNIYHLTYVKVNEIAPHRLEKMTQKEYREISLAKAMQNLYFIDTNMDVATFLNSNL